MDNEAIQEQVTEEPKGFDELTSEEQQEVIKAAFFSEDVEDEEEGEGDNDSADDENEEAEDEAPKGDEEEQPKDETGEAALPESEAKPEYTPEEFLLLDPSEVDSSRLPDAARIVHDRNMQYFTQTIAPQLEELKQLRAFRDEALKRQNEPQQPKSEPVANSMADFNAAVKAEAAKRLGVTELDEFNTDHNITVALVAGELQRAMFQRQEQMAAQRNNMAAAQRTYQSAVTDLQQEYGSDFAVIDNWALKELENLPHKTYETVIRDLRSGDLEKIKATYRLFAERYKAQRTAAMPKPVKKADTPKVIGGSGGDVGPKTSWGVREFSNATAQEQTRMLQDLYFK